jgi:hypothetical protein
MNLTKLSCAIFVLLTLCFSCQKESIEKSAQIIAQSQQPDAAKKVTQTTITETFETGTKTAYADATVTLSTGIWDFNDALLGNSTADAKDGTQSARVRNSGILTTNFDYTTGASTVTVKHGLYGSDASGTWQLWYSTNGGTGYTETGSTITTSSTTLATATFTLNVSGNIRFQIRKTDGGSNRINFDDFAVTNYSGSGGGGTNPTLTSISPDSATAGGATFTLTATGTAFVSGATIDWNGVALTTTYKSATKLTASVPVADIAAAGTDSVKVVLPTGGASASLAFLVKAKAGATPTLTSLSPDSTAAGGAAFTITATGTKFVSGATIDWNGTALTTTYVSATKLTATVPATDIATAGTASVTVVLPMGGTSAVVSFKIQAPIVTTGKKFLFDASHAETAGNADWVIDEDNSTPQRIPTPAQSTITASTPETYWTGALSSWGIALVKAGNYVETLPATGAITYGNTSNAQDLSNYSVFIVDEPNTPFTAAEKTAILEFVQNGGGLCMISDHDGASRLNNGWEAVTIWNDLMTNNTVQNNPFGFSIDLTNISQQTANVLTNSTTNPILNGTQGKVTEIEYDNGATISLQPTVNSTVQGLIWETGDAQGNTNVMAASSTFGTGRVFVEGDSSPADDGTGASGNELYVGWPTLSHTQLFMNASLWLAKLQ